MLKLLTADIDACMERDPAARSRLEVVLTYPGFHALLMHRLAHGLWRRRWRLLARILAYWARFVTGIEIHPGARIGSGLFIDHGTGVVIGETATIGRNVTLYHDVTLGGIAPSVDSAAQRDQKRHPTLLDDVIVGSGAQVLGPVTVGEGARIGANSVALQDVPAGATMVGIPARVVRGRAPEQEQAKAAQRFVAYGTSADLPDPVQRVMDALLDRVQTLSARVGDLEHKLEEAERRQEALSEAVDEESEAPDAKLPSGKY